MATVAALYSSPTTITLSPASLASSTTFVAGRESTEVDNTTNLYVDALVQGRVTVGTTPTANTRIQIHVWGSDTSLATTALDTLDGTDSAETLTNTGMLNTVLKLAAVIDVSAATSDLAYPFAPFSVATALGLTTLPRYWGLYLTHNTVAALHATAGNHVFSFTGVKYTVV